MPKSSFLLFLLFQQNVSALDRRQRVLTGRSAPSCPSCCRRLLVAGRRAHIDEVLPGESGERNPIAGSTVLEIAADAG